MLLPIENIKTCFQSAAEVHHKNRINLKILKTVVNDEESQLATFIFICIFCLVIYGVINGK
jgi:hypothetical protein